MDFAVPGKINGGKWGISVYSFISKKKQGSPEEDWERNTGSVRTLALGPRLLPVMLGAD